MCLQLHFLVTWYIFLYVVFWVTKPTLCPVLVILAANGT